MQKNFSSAWTSTSRPSCEQKIALGLEGPANGKATASALTLSINHRQQAVGYADDGKEVLANAYITASASERTMYVKQLALNSLNLIFETEAFLVDNPAFKYATKLRIDLNQLRAGIGYTGAISASFVTGCENILMGGHLDLVSANRRNLILSSSLSYYGICYKEICCANANANR